MFRVRVHATQKELALITKAARMQGLSAPQYITRVASDLGKKQNTFKTARPNPTSPEQTKPPRPKRKS